MTNAELISLLAVVVTFLTTLVGWIFTYRSQRKTQKEIASLNEKFSIEREKRQYKLIKLNDMESWFNEGLKLAMDEMARAYRKTVEDSTSEPNILIRSYREQVIVWIASIARYYVLASEYDSIKNIDEQKYQGLARLVMSFSAEVIKHIDEMVYAEDGKVFVTEPIKLIDLGVDGIRAIERVRENILREQK